MTRRRRRRLAILLTLTGLLLTACTGAAPPSNVATKRAAPRATTSTAPETTTTTTAPPAPPPPSVTAASVAPTTRPRPTAPPRPRVVHEQPWTPFAQAAEVILHHPSSRVERVGFHESNHEGARQMEPLPTAADPITLESRGRGTGSRTAADVVTDPEVEIRAPVTGTVKRAGSYVLYCDKRDDYAVIEPDQHPGWEVKILHISGVQVRAGDRVVAGETVLAPRPTQLPFESQVDETTAAPPWPHVHIEVVDPSIPNKPSPGGGC